jgi:hypothetical protein
MKTQRAKRMRRMRKKTMRGGVDETYIDPNTGNVEEEEPIYMDVGKKSPESGEEPEEEETEEEEPEEEEEEPEEEEKSAAEQSPTIFKKLFYKLFPATNTEEQDKERLRDFINCIELKPKQDDNIGWVQFQGPPRPKNLSYLTREEISTINKEKKEKREREKREEEQMKCFDKIVKNIIEPFERGIPENMKYKPDPSDPSDPSDIGEFCNAMYDEYKGLSGWNFSKELENFINKTKNKYNYFLLILFFMMSSLSEHNKLCSSFFKKNSYNLKNEIKKTIICVNQGQIQGGRKTRRRLRTKRKTRKLAKNKYRKYKS